MQTADRDVGQVRMEIEGGRGGEVRLSLEKLASRQTPYHWREKKNLGTASQKAQNFIGCITYPHMAACRAERKRPRLAVLVSVRVSLMPAISQEVVFSSAAHLIIRTTQNQCLSLEWYVLKLIKWKFDTAACKIGHMINNAPNTTCY